jgi:hypothetical protein
MEEEKKSLDINQQIKHFIEKEFNTSVLPCLEGKYPL